MKYVPALIGVLTVSAWSLRAGDWTQYRGPNGETWSGRGLAPRWLAELERKGKNRDSYLINKG